MNAFKVAVVGAGSMGREHIRAFAALDGVEVAGLHSRTREKAEALAGELNVPVVAGSPRELFDMTQADLVVVAVHELAANGVAKACFAHDWGVLLEKPAGHNLADAEDIAAGATAHGQPVMVGLNRRFYDSTRQVKADLDSRDERRFIHVLDQQSYDEARRYNHPEAVVETFMYANSIHIIDFLANFGRGAVTEVRPIMPWHGEDTEVCLVHVAFDSGDTGLYEGIWKGPGPWAVSVSTPSRRWVMQPLETAEFQNADERVRHAVRPDPVDSAYKAGFLRQAEAVVQRMRGKASAAVDISESLRVMRLIHAMFGV